MASSYVNDLRLNEMATGDASGTWGTTTNTNLELIAEAFSYGTEAITTNADTHTTTIADGATDPGRALYLKYTGTLDSACTITIGPNTVSKVWIIENGTSGSQDIILSQGSGANITIPAGDTKVVYSDGAGAGAAFFDAFASINVGALTGTSLDISGDIDVDGTTNLDIVDIDGAVDMASTLTVGGNVTVPNLLVADDITHSGDADTYISFEADARTDYVGGIRLVDLAPGSIVLNEGSGDVDFRVESNGNANMLFVDGGTDRVGIGTSSPVQVLHLGGATNKAIQITSSTSNAGYFGVYQDQAGFSVNRDASDGTFADANKTEAAIVLQSQNANSFIAFRTTPTNNAEAPERMRIDKDGSVGINTTSPTQKLHVNGESRFEDYLYGSTANNKLYINEDVAISAGKKLYLDTGSNTYLSQVSADVIDFVTDGTERARITAAGQLAVGTTGYGTGVLAYNRDVGAAFGMNITENTTFNDASGHIFYSKQNTHLVIYINVAGVGLTAIPAYPNGGGGVAYTWNYLDPDAGTWTYGAGTVTFTMGGSPSNAFTVAFAGGSGQITITRTSGSSLYRVVMMEFAQQ
jgi:hypothetical protein